MFFGLFSGMAQDNFARLTTIIGSHIEFNFNSLDKYNTGIRITDGTTIAVTMENLPLGASVTGWHLDAQSFMAQPTIDGSGGITLPLNTIQIEATDANTNLSGSTFFGLQDLAVAPGATLMTTAGFGAKVPANPNTHQINLSYECGMANGSLLGSTGGYYTVEIEIILIPDF
jgi:hypothetical protein